MRVGLRGMALLALGLACGFALNQRAMGAGEGGERQPSQIRHGDVPIGSLGYPLGDYITVEGRRAEGNKISTQTLQVDKLNGKKLKEPTAIEVANVRALPKRSRIVLKGNRESSGSSR
jgi:hypothetical protein